MPDIEMGKCEMCGELNQIHRTYYNYDIKCECHSPNHFVLVRHCRSCKPEPQEKIVVTIKPLKEK